MHVQWGRHHLHPRKLETQFVFLMISLSIIYSLSNRISLTMLWVQMHIKKGCGTGSATLTETDVSVLIFYSQLKHKHKFMRYALRNLPIQLNVWLKIIIQSESFVIFIVSWKYRTSWKNESLQCLLKVTSSFWRTHLKNTQGNAMIFFRV